MRNLIEFLARHNHWLVFLLLEVISLVLLFHYNSYQGSVWFSSANAVAGKVYETRAGIEQYFSLVDVNKQLTARNLHLERELTELSAQLNTEKHDSTYAERLQKTAIKGYQTIPAKVVSNTVDKHDNFLTIDKGRADGVKDGMGVVSGTGVVGIVYLVSEHYAVVIPILSSKSSISCSLQGRGYFGYLHWTGGDTRKAWLDDVPRHAAFRLYDKVVTNGYSSVFPAGILVGKVLHVYNSPDGIAYRIQVELSTDFAKLRDVCVIDNQMLEERLQIMRAAKDSLKAK